MSGLVFTLYCMNILWQEGFLVGVDEIPPSFFVGLRGVDAQGTPAEIVYLDWEAREVGVLPLSVPVRTTTRYLI